MKDNFCTVRDHFSHSGELTREFFCILGYDPYHPYHAFCGFFKLSEKRNQCYNQDRYYGYYCCSKDAQDDCLMSLRLEEL